MNRQWIKSLARALIPLILGGLVTAIVLAVGGPYWFSIGAIVLVGLVLSTLYGLIERARQKP